VIIKLNSTSITRIIRSAFCFHTTTTTAPSIGVHARHPPHISPGCSNFIKGSTFPPPVFLRPPLPWIIEAAKLPHLVRLELKVAPGSFLPLIRILILARTQID
jgi:hypothetical protein